MTPTQRRIYRVLEDGLPHTRQELMKCLTDELASAQNLTQHIYIINRDKKLPTGLKIMNSYARRRVTYRLVRLISGE